MTISNLEHSHKEYLKKVDEVRKIVCPWDEDCTKNIGPTLIEYTRFQKFPFEPFEDKCFIVHFEEKKYCLRDSQDILDDISSTLKNNYDSQTAESLHDGSLYLATKFYNLYKRRNYSDQGKEYDWLCAIFLENSVQFRWNPSWYPYLYFYHNEVIIRWVNVGTMDELPEYEYGKRRGSKAMIPFLEGVWNKYESIKTCLPCNY